MRTTIAALMIAVGSSASAATTASFCEDLWFTRNAVINGAGYCFGSTLGQSVFGTTDCIGTSISLDPQTRQFVSQVQALEARLSCRVDTSVPQLELPDLAWRRQVQELPLLDELAWGCLGWGGPRVRLHAGRSNTAPAIGEIEPGDYVNFNHVPAGGWNYVTVQVPGWNGLKSAGWLQPGLVQTACHEVAG